jgi:hypothetical protein
MPTQAGVAHRFGVHADTRVPAGADKGHLWTSATATRRTIDRSVAMGGAVEDASR